MSITLLVMTDGRDHIFKTLPRALEQLRGPMSVRVIHDDSGDPEFAEQLWDTFGPHGFLVVSTGGRSGFSGAYRSAWQWLRDHDRNEYIWNLEDDFLITPIIHLLNLVAVLQQRPDITQLALLRQAWSPAEKLAGGIIAQHPDDYAREWCGPHSFTTHRRFWTTNPSMFRRDLILEHEWPEGPESEGHFSIDLFSDPSLKSAFWGAGVNCEHIGHQRVGGGY